MYICNMYKDKKFRIKTLDEIKEEIDFFRAQIKYVRRIFLADGDALIIKTSTLLEILNYLNEKFPEKERVSIYASPKSLMLKTPEELRTLKETGIELVYIGLESGDNEVLTNVNKGSTVENFIVGVKKAKEVDADVVVICDPDGDRLGVVAKHDGEYVLMSGNQSAAVYLEYI